jgi:hypothetical protein
MAKGLLLFMLEHLTYAVRGSVWVIPYLLLGTRDTQHITLRALILIVMSECTASLLSITGFLSACSGSVIDAEVVTQASCANAFHLYLYQMTTYRDAVATIYCVFRVRIENAASRYSG